MIGSQIRLNKLLPAGERIIILPIDHGEFQGPRKGLVNPRDTLQSLTGYDAVLLAPGMLERCWDVFAARKSLVSIVRLNWNSDYCFQWDYRTSIHSHVLSPAQALAWGADVALASLTVGTGDPAVDAANVELFARLVAEARAVGLPIGSEVYPGEAGRLPEKAFHDLVLRNCRIASELGADFVKTFYTGPQFREVVEATPIPIIVLGAQKVEEPQALRMAADGIAAGARGVVFGRNVFESNRPQAFLDALGEVVRRGESPEAAAQKFGFVPQPSKKTTQNQS
jgi:DhnA family fructose-bisphosphate aldolase class Ia